MIDVEPLIRTELESLMPLPEGSRSEWADVLARSGHRHRRSRRRPLLVLAAGICTLAAGGAAIAAGLGAFSGATVAQLKACVPSTTALTTASGARLRTGHTDGGIVCLAYEDANGSSGWSAGRLGESPAGDVLAVKALDTASQAYVIAGVVPAGYTTLTLGSVQIPIVNQAFAVDPKLVIGPGMLSGPAGRITINLSELAAP